MGIMKLGANKMDINAIKKMYEDGKSVAQIHKRLRIHKATIQNFTKTFKKRKSQVIAPDNGAVPTTKE